jgi:hypothetical protein
MSMPSMADITRVVRRPRRARPAARTVALSIVTAGLALPAAGCGGSSGSHVAQLGSTATQRSSSSRGSAAPGKQSGALAFSGCMRQNGVPKFPDPGSSGAIPKVGLEQLGVSSTQFQAAETACASLLRPSNTQARQTLGGMVDFAHCMRSHGVHDWPDPTIDRDGQAVFDLHGRINPDTAQMDAESGRCSHLLHPSPGQDGTVLCNGIGEAGCHHYG